MGPRRGLRRLGLGLETHRLARVAVRTLLVVLGVAAVVATESACTSARPVLAYFFDGVPAEGQETVLVPVTRPPRRGPYKKPDKVRPVVDLGEARQVVDWSARYAELPRSAAGDVAWTKALESKLIAPLPGLAADAKGDEPADMDVEHVPDGQPEFKSVFSHRVHTLWMGCPACHDAIFAMEKSKGKMTMASLNQGAFCGVCHGKVAAPDMNGCPACHTAMGK